MKRKLGINIECIGGTEPRLALELIKAAGFESITAMASSEEYVLSVKDAADELGLDFPFIHSPIIGESEMWREGEGYLPILEGKKRAVDCAALAGVPAVVVHVSSGWNPPPVCDAGLSRYDELVEYAEARGVIIAFENVRSIADLATLAERYAGRGSVRFCFDCGHEYGFTASVSWLDIFRDRLFATHLHDNFGRDPFDYESNPDLHLLPFDGSYDFPSMMRRLDLYGFEGALTFEVFQSKRAEYSALTREAFLALAYERAVRLASL